MVAAQLVASWERPISIELVRDGSSKINKIFCSSIKIPWLIYVYIVCYKWHFVLEENYVVYNCLSTNEHMICGWLPGFSKKELYHVDIQEFILQKFKHLLLLFWTYVRSELLMMITAFWEVMPCSLRDH